jgi:hypothetical protein
MHLERLRKYGDVHRTAGPFGQPDEAHYKWLGNSATYIAMHNRMRKRLGLASAHMCAEQCGNRALHWSYDHTDSNDKIDASTGLIYSVDMTHYTARCAKCHKRLDIRMRDTWRH